MSGPWSPAAARALWETTNAAIANAWTGEEREAAIDAEREAVAEWTATDPSRTTGWAADEGRAR